MPSDPPEPIPAPAKTYGGLLSGVLKRARLRHAARHLRPGDAILDLGCGDGDLAARLPDGATYLGVDVDEAVLAEARARHPGHRFAHLDVNAGVVALGEQVDVLVALAVVEHVPDPAAVLADAARMLRPGGRVIVTTPHPRSRRIHDMGAAVRIFSPEAADEHEAFLGRAELAAIAGDALTLTTYRRFQLGLNQLAVYSLGAAPGD